MVSVASRFFEAGIHSGTERRKSMGRSLDLFDLSGRVAIVTGEDEWVSVSVSSSCYTQQADIQPSFA